MDYVIGIAVCSYPLIQTLTIIYVEDMKNSSRNPGDVEE
jgi:hypothetical protein